MSEIVDPLKVRSFGVKRPMEEKTNKLRQSQSGDYRRYYPKNRQGNIDEWGAMIR